VKDSKAEDATRQPEQVKAFRDTWQLGIHSYLAYLRDRLVMARELLTETGSVFVQMGDENVHLVRSLLDEVFGSDNFCSQIVYVTTSTQGSDLLPVVNDNLLWYAKDRAIVKNRNLFDEKAIGGIGSSGYNFIELPDGTERRATAEEIEGSSPVPQKAK
jgi:adenine-specific DNA-methyltransferase